MATDISDIVKQGYTRVRSRTVGIWQKRWVILRRASSKGPCRLEKYFDERSARNGLQHKTALLTDVATISRLPSTTKRYAFAVNFHDGTNKCFTCDSGKKDCLICKTNRIMTDLSSCSNWVCLICFKQIWKLIPGSSY